MRGKRIYTSAYLQLDYFYFSNTLLRETICSLSFKTEAAYGCRVPVLTTRFNFLQIFLSTTNNFWWHFIGCFYFRMLMCINVRSLTIIFFVYFYNKFWKRNVFLKFQLMW